MKTNKIYVALFLMSFMAWSCTTQDSLSSKSFKTALTTNVQELTTAMEAISATPGYQVLSISNTTTASSSPSLVKSSITAFDSTYSSILLSDIAGVYEYKANHYKRGGMSLLRFFTKTGDSSLMVVRLPEEKVKRPGNLLHFAPGDTALVNNYVVTLSNYQYKFNHYQGWNYQMASNINIKNVNAGNLNIQSSNSKQNGYKYASGFEFADGYKATCNYATGDTAVATYAISNGTKTLYEEKYTAIKTAQDNRHREREYSLTIGDVQIVRTQGHGMNSLDSAKVYVAGVLQLNAKVEIVDMTDSTSTASTEDLDNCVMNHKRELKITFDDGTSSTISQLLGTSVDTIRNLFASLRQASFSTAIIDRIAWDIYTNKE